MTSFPNQMFVTIHKEPCIQGFLQVNKSDWMEAWKDSFVDYEKNRCQVFDGGSF